MTHRVAVAQMLSELRMDLDTISAARAGLRRRTDPDYLEDLEDEFDIEVALVDGVTKMEQLPTDISAMKGGKAGNKELEYLRKYVSGNGQRYSRGADQAGGSFAQYANVGYLSPNGSAWP